jgi:hypothetical protein
MAAGRYESNSGIQFQGQRQGAPEPEQDPDRFGRGYFSPQSPSIPVSLTLALFTFSTPGLSPPLSGAPTGPSPGTP